MGTGPSHRRPCRRTVEGFETETESEGTWNVLVVRYADGGREVAYALLDINGALALGDID